MTQAKVDVGVWRRGARRGVIASLFASLLALSASGCATHPFGPRAIQPARLGYNEALVRSADQQLLLNIVRLRYRDNPLFLDVSNIVAQYGRDVSASAALLLASPGGSDEVGAGFDFGMSENPLITLTPLRGDEFASRMLAPIAAKEVVALAFSGWSIGRLLICCVQEIHGVRNAITASGPTPAVAPEFEPFHRAAALLRKFQLSGALAISLDAEGSVVLNLKADAARIDPAELAELRRILTLEESTERIRLVPPTIDLSTSDVPYLGRSLLGVFYLLSQAVEVPAEHEQRGWVTVTRDAQGERFDWSRVLGSIFRVHSGSKPPTESAVAVRYRGTWFWVADDDLDSKSTLSLVTLFFTLKSGSGSGATPLIAISK
jgi:hypothetical protein